MSDQFIIVIEADNRRAHAAYCKGLADLDVIWPQIVAHAAELDAVLAQKLDARDAEARADRERSAERLRKYEQSMTEYRESLARWTASNTLFRGPAPSYPYSADFGVGGWLGEGIDHRYMGLHRGMHQAKFDSIRRELQRMADLAGAALGPYRMTEQAVGEMIAWENGSRIEKLKAEITKGTTP